MVVYTRAVLLIFICGILIKGYTSSTEFFTPEEYLRYEYRHEKKNCLTITDMEPCLDIRVCSKAAATLALGETPSLCGWVGKGVPRVCCGETLVKGPTLIKKIEAEKARRRECGTVKFSPGLSPTENLFNILANTLPVGTLNKTDSRKFDPPLDFNASNDDFVLGGEKARQGEFSWMVSIRKHDEHWCGGTLIDRVHVLTAAHCFDEERDASKYTVHVGNVFVDKGYPIGVAKVITHPDYSEEYHYHDLAILTLDKEILIPQIAHICLPDPALPELAGQNTSLLGWGATTFDGESATDLQIANDLPVVPWEECREKYRKIDSYTLPDGITEDFLCAGLPDGGKDACQEDSGGPLMYQQKFNSSENELIPWTLVGVVSFGFGCGFPGYPGVYIRVANYMPWILENTKQ